jgi:hypothetical protein
MTSLHNEGIIKNWQIWSIHILPSFFQAVHTLHSSKYTWHVISMFWLNNISTSRMWCKLHLPWCTNHERWHEMDTALLYSTTESDVLPDQLCPFFHSPPVLLRSHTDSNVYIIMDNQTRKLASKIKVQLKSNKAREYSNQAQMEL